jgi:spore maturation protein CgeB
MRVVMFYHSLVSDWNHGNAHFLRGIVSELLDRGHDVRVLEPRDGWSRMNLLQDHGAESIDRFHRAYPRLHSEMYDLATLDLDDVLRDADVAMVHEWNDHALVARIGDHARAHRSYRLLFHDTHHRSVTDPSSMRAYDLRHYDGVLAFGDAIRDLYLDQRWVANGWTWHEAADDRMFFPRRPESPSRQGGLDSDDEGDVVWIGNWGDEERTAELEEFVIGPVRDLGLRATLYGVRYPDAVRQQLAQAGIAYGGWLPNYEAPAVFARHKVTIHVPRRPYVDQLTGIPTIRPFEALACGIPLISARWEQTGGLFTPGEDFLVARDGGEMRSHLRMLVADADRRNALAAHGLATIRARHTCAHRVDELAGIWDELAAN